MRTTTRGVMSNGMLNRALCLLCVLAAVAGCRFGQYPNPNKLAVADKYDGKALQTNVHQADMVLNVATPVIEVDPETYEVRADGQLLTCPPATELPMAQRYFLF